MKRFVGLVLAACLVVGVPAEASAKPHGQLTASSETSMLLATLLGSHSPSLSAAKKAVLARYRAGKTDAKAGNITVTADRIDCTGGAKAETAFACDLKFGARTVHLTARAASQLFAALEMVGQGSDADTSPFGPYSASASAVSCTLHAAVIAKNAVGGADCVYTPAPRATNPASASTADSIKVDDDSSLLVAALVGSYSPTLSAADKAALAHYLAGQPTLDAGVGKFTVSADQVGCVTDANGGVDSWCDLTFGDKSVHLDNAAATELDAALRLTGLPTGIGMQGDDAETHPLTCVIDPAAIAAQANGAVCTLAP